MALSAGTDVMVVGGVPERDRCDLPNSTVGRVVQVDPFGPGTVAVEMYWGGEIRVYHESVLAALDTLTQL